MLFRRYFTGLLDGKSNPTSARNIDCLKKAEDRPLIVLLDYGPPMFDTIADYNKQDMRIIIKSKVVKKDILNVALVGAGSFATGVHLPNLEQIKNKYSLRAVVDKVGSRAKAIAKQYGASYATSDINSVLEDEQIDLVLITTRHDSHAPLILSSLQAGKHVFVEKPLATNAEDLTKIMNFYSHESSTLKPVLTVGFNRRFSEFAREIKKQTDQRISPLFIHYRMNAGYISQDHWVHENGGRIVGEACHIIDLMSFLTGNSLLSISFDSMNPTSGKFNTSDNKSIILKYSDGSIATIEYFAVGSRQFPKEYMEVHFDEKSIVMEDYKKLNGFNCNIKEINNNKSNKGHFGELQVLYDCITGVKTEWPIPIEQLIETTRATLLISQT